MEDKIVSGVVFETLCSNKLTWDMYVCIDLADMRNTSIETIQKSNFNLHGFTSGLKIS